MAKKSKKLKKRYKPAKVETAFGAVSRMSPTKEGGIQPLNFYSTNAKPGTRPVRQPAVGKIRYMYYLNRHCDDITVRIHGIKTKSGGQKMPGGRGVDGWLSTTVTPGNLLEIIVRHKNTLGVVNELMEIEEAEFSHVYEVTMMCSGEE